MFNKDSFQFLSDIKENNNKAWLVEQRQRYEEALLNPLKELITDLEIFITTIDNSLETKPVTNKAISTIYRDTRFSKNKLPLKSYIGFNFRKRRPDWKQFPAFIFRITPDGYIFGLAVMKNNSDHFYNLRAALDNKIDDLTNSKESFLNAINELDFNNDFEVWGEEYKKYHYQGANQLLKGFYNKKNLFIKCARTPKYYKNKKELVLDIQNQFQILVPLYKYLNQIFAVSL